MNYKYKITASHLNAYQRLLDADIDANELSNFTEDGLYRKTPDEIYIEREQALLDLINRVQREPNEAADRGTAFNEIIDCILAGRNTLREDMSIQSVFVDFNGTIYTQNTEIPARAIEAIMAQINGFTFVFEKAFCKRIAKYFKGCLCQSYVSADMQTRYGDVLLYGYADYIGTLKVADLKTTSKYHWGKYEHGWQRYVYPYCIEESGDMRVIDFAYEVCVLENKKGVISGKSYRESYLYVHEIDKKKLQEMCERFIEWLELNRSKITDAKIFGA